MTLIRTRKALANEDGVALVAVLVIMFVGAIAAILIAGTVIFTIQANAQSKSTTQAFVAAESGWEVALANALQSPCDLSEFRRTDRAHPPLYVAQATVTSGADESGCPSGTETSLISITSTGTGPDGSTDTVTAIYRREVTFTNQPGGTTSAMYGTFKNTDASYIGDLVVRGGKYTCNSGGTVTGNLWVLWDPVSGVGGDVVLGTDCTVTGSIYAQGSVTTSGAKVTVGGNVIAAGSGANVEASTGTIAGGVYADGTIDLAGATAKSFLAGGAVTGATAVNVTDYVTSAAQCRPTPPAGVPPLCTVNGELTATPGTAMYVPDPATVWKMTTWVDLDRTSSWGSNIQWHVPPAGDCPTDWTSVLTEPLTAGNTAVGVDLSLCKLPTNGKGISLTPVTTQTNDVLFIFKSGTPMAITVNGSLNPLLSASGAAGWPQIFLVHADSTMGNSLPDCGSGLAGDSVVLPTVDQARVMIYTPCGLDPSSLNGSGKYSMHGQYYSNAADGKNVAQPIVDCQLMSWSTLLNMGCQIAPEGGTVGGEVNAPKAQLPKLISQVEE